MSKIIKKHWLTYVLAVILSIGSAFLFAMFSVRLGTVVDVVVNQDVDFVSKI